MNGRARDLVEAATTRLKQRLACRVVEAVQARRSAAVRVLGRELVVPRNVLNPKYFETSELMASCLRIGPNDAVLDVGTGSGIQAIVAAASAREVVATDVDPAAVRAARENCARNGVENVTVLEGDLFAPLAPEQRFDVILFTPPYMDGWDDTPLARALYDPGKALLRRFLGAAARHLSDGGYVQMLYSTIAGTEEAMRLAVAAGWDRQLVAERRALIETYTIHRLRPVRPSASARRDEDAEPVAR
ncbi:MAG: methyltransferase [Sandaracinaceae bacterium]|nr:methyltransferase [Sandaracinaceae bacterium]